MRACRSGPVLVRYRPEAVRIGQVPDRFCCVAARPHVGIKNKSNDNKTTLVAFLTFLLLGGGICASDKFALANISTRSTSAEGRDCCGGADFVVAGGIAGGQNDSLRCRGWRQGGIVANLCLPVPKLSPGNTLHFLSQNTWQYITKFRWSMWSYSSITVADDGGSSIWRLGCRWWHPGLQSATDGCGAVDFRWRYRLTIHHDVYLCVCHYICKCSPCKSIE